MVHRSKRFTGPLTQTAVYWSTPASDGYGGRTYAEPVEISARWEQKQELFIDANGQEVRSNAIVFVSADLDLGGLLWLGTLAALDSTEEDFPETIAEAREIRSIEKIPDRSGAGFARRVWL